MSFRFYTTLLSQASKRIASGILIVGLLLIGFGVLIYALPRIFATIAAFFFFIVGGGCFVSGVKLLWTQREIDKMSSGGIDDFRQNVHIHHEEDYEL